MPWYNFYITRSNLTRWGHGICLFINGWRICGRMRIKNRKILLWSWALHGNSTSSTKAENGKCPCIIFSSSQNTTTSPWITLRGSLKHLEGYANHLRHLRHLRWGLGSMFVMRRYWSLHPDGIIRWNVKIFSAAGLGLNVCDAKRFIFTTQRTVEQFHARQCEITRIVCLMSISLQNMHR